MKRPIFSWQKTLLQLGRRVVWQNKSLNRSRKTKLPEHQTQRRPTWETLEPRHLLAGIQFQLDTQQAEVREHSGETGSTIAEVREHSGAFFASSSPSPLLGEKGPGDEGSRSLLAESRERSGELLAEGEGSASSLWLRGDGNANDSIGTNHGALVGDAAYVNGRAGKSFSFDGNGDEVRIAESALLNDLTFSYSLWFRLGDTGTYPNLAGRQFADTQGWTLHITPSGNLGLRIDTEGYAGQGYYQGINLDDSQWHFASVSINDATKQARLSVDGSFAQTFNYAGNFTNNSGGHFSLGGQAVGATWLNGQIDDFKIYDTALSSSELADLRSGPYSGTLANVPQSIGWVDTWSAIMVIDKTTSHTNTTSISQTIQINQFDVTIGVNRGRVTPFLAKQIGSGPFSVVAVGATRVSGVDYNNSGVFQWPFSTTPTVVKLAPGETLLTGFTDANADGSGASENVVPFVETNSHVWLTGSPYSSGAGSISVGSEPVLGGYTYPDLTRTYQFSIRFSESQYPNVAATGIASQSSTLWNSEPYSANRGIDGNIDGTWGAGTTAYTYQEHTPANSWWQVLLRTSAAIDHLEIHNRIDYLNDQSNFRISVWNLDPAQIHFAKERYTMSTCPSNTFHNHRAILARVLGLYAVHFRRWKTQTLGIA